MLSHLNLASNLLQTNATEEFSEHSLVVLPYYHIYALMVMNVSLFQGKCQVVLPKFDPENFLHCMQKYKVCIEILSSFTCYAIYTLF